MRRSMSLMLRIWIAIVSVALVSVLAVAVVVRQAFRSAFGFYLEHQVMMGAARGGGETLMLGATEQEFQLAVDNGILVSGAIVIVVSLLVAYVVARALVRPLDRLTSAAGTLAEGDLSHRVDIRGSAEVERLGAAFNDMAASLEEAEGLRCRMVADVAHELRNPVAALRAQAEGMAEGVLEADPARIDSLVEDAAHLSRLVGDLQELSVAEAGRLSYERVEFDLSGLIEREVERASLQAAVGVGVEASCSTGSTVMADERRIAQVLRNLLSNALRHTKEGSVLVRCASGPREVTVTVEDTGEGIPAGDLPYVFERLYRADAARARKTGGAGIGLSVARRIVEDHGGTVLAESEPGIRTVVGFRLPRWGGTG